MDLPGKVEGDREDGGVPEVEGGGGLVGGGPAEGVEGEGRQGVEQQGGQPVQGVQHQAVLPHHDGVHQAAQAQHVVRIEPAQVVREDEYLGEEMVEGWVEEELLFMRRVSTCTMVDRLTK